ncbi:hypothetical protein [Parafrankia sp. FMc2]|uniref:hypothetical protein n=1 Tax=Parafrankia sp. FMc2 TaxID=3233196 RepID=UPI0034D42822
MARENARRRLAELDAERERLRMGGMSARHPEYELLMRERDVVFEAATGYHPGCRIRRGGACGCADRDA